MCWDLISSEARYRREWRQGAVIRARVLQQVLETARGVVVHQYRSTVVLRTDGSGAFFRIHHAIIENAWERLAQQGLQVLRDAASGIIAASRDGVVVNINL